MSVSFLSVAAGSAFGLWTGVGALVGILSMAVASIFGGLFGGLAVKTSGPTGSTAAVLFAATAGLAMTTATVDSAALIGMSLAITAVLIFGLSFLPVHRILDVIPNIAVAVFINGVALLLLWKQGQQLWGLGELSGAARRWEIGLALGSFCLLTAWKRLGPFLKTIPGGQIVSGSLAAMGLSALLVALFDPDVKTLSSTALDLSVLLPDFSSLAAGSFPLAELASTTLKITGTVAFVTLVTARALGGEGPVAYGRELRNQSLANLAVAGIGGIPVTIGFIRTRILQRSGAVSPAVGPLTGVFILLILWWMQPLLTRIPTSVFIGILLRAGLVSLDLQVWRQFREAPSRHGLPLAFVLTGAVSSVFLDPITVLIIAVPLWSVLERIHLSRRRCHDLAECPGMA